MKLIILAFILSISLHLLIFSPITEKKEEIKESPSTSKQINKSKVHYVRLLPKATVPNVIQKKVSAKKEIIKEVKTKKYVIVKKEKIIPQKKKKVVNKQKKIIPKTILKTKRKETFTKKVQINPQEKRKTIEKKSLENFFLKNPEPLDRNMLDAITQEYLRVYGKEYDSFTKVQKVFLQNNLETFTRITQRTLNRLGYPRLAERLGLSGSNIVEFIFYPDGSISDLKLSLKSRHEVFDKRTIELIEFAYKDYPRPKEKIKIKFTVSYRFY